jgi:hypothetical protein
VGSSTYSSNTLYVGDGTWDSSRNNFLLPNLVGLNLDTMRYNGNIFFPSVPNDPKVDQVLTEYFCRNGK